MAVATVKFRKKFLLGPLAAELVVLDTPDTGDTFETDLVNAKFALGLTAGEAGAVVNPSALIVNRTVTLNTWSGADGDIAFLVIGY